MKRPLYLGLGSNHGDRLYFLSKAIDSLGLLMDLKAVSPIYETEPVGMDTPELFLNLAVEGESSLYPTELLQKLIEIEERLGRVTLVRMKPREIDIDILLYGSRVFRDNVLEIPHPRMSQRRFVLAPLNDIAPHALHPVSKKTVRELYRDCNDLSNVVKTKDKLTIHQLT